MAETVTFIHAADLHLGAPFRGFRKLSDAWVSRLSTAVSEAYDRIIETAISADVDFVVFAGDIFDTDRPSYADFVHFIDGLQELDKHGIPVVFCNGNHDPSLSWKHEYAEFPPNTFMLKGDEPDYTIIRKDGEPICVVAGRSFYASTFPPNESVLDGMSRKAAIAILGPEAEKAPFFVGVAHTGLDIDASVAPVSRSALLASDFDFWALGHIHKREIVPADKPKFAFAGCPQGRDINEPGARGVNLVTLSRGRSAKVKFVPCASIVWQRIDIDTTHCKTMSDIYESIVTELFRVNSEAYCEEMCVRVTLVGSTELHQTLADEQVVEDLRNNINNKYRAFFIDELINKTKKPYDRQTLIEEGLFPATFMKVAAGMRANQLDQVSLVQSSLAAKHFNIGAFRSSDIADLIDEAESFGLDILTEGEDIR